MSPLRVAMLALVLAACGRPFDVKTAPGFLELKEASAHFAYRATTPEGVVVGVRVVDVEGEGSHDLGFWTRAMTLELRDAGGYALVETRDVKSRDGVPGKQLRFGHDESGKPYVYWVTFFAADDHLIVAEAGGSKAHFEAAQSSVEWMLASLAVR
ncbi:MAG TPA: serine/threonine protein kinase [Polyangiaceae bacterium]|jgi:hypothetical protein